MTDERVLTPFDNQAQQEYAEKLAEHYGHESLAKYQEFYGLEPDGIAGPITTTHLSGRFCMTPDFASVSAGGPEEAQFPRTCVEIDCVYFFDQVNAAPSIVEKAWKDAIGKWNATCGIKLKSVKANSRSELESKKDKAISQRQPLIWANDGPLPGSTLAWSFLPQDRCDDRIEQRYDTLVNWDFEFLVKVIFHELGHAIGLEHSNDQNDIMYPSITNKPWSVYPGPGDISRTVARYGPSTDPDPGPDPDPDPPTDEDAKELAGILSENCKDLAAKLDTWRGGPNSIV